MGRLSFSFRGAMLGIVLGVLSSTSAARADVGPSCGCEVGSRTALGRGALAATFGVLGLGALFVERTRRRARAQR